ncbi:response regulator transcription factor [Limnobaculum zhutongyuii]|uniref:Response regulator transcription factor n=1 Tax=Limnobaculum zhutongyuii TaxID=2498113 RepID=A0A411WJD2_9GAMM|nr:response regulator transcription factor [Limnobaculum zhutongyuii]QBH96292.1 response regulator transcription factor [Limnobaculum zhutongyuii]TQS87119.1 response regulator transcription factor [Limnobaculum zhutongyuii]
MKQQVIRTLIVDSNQFVCFAISELLKDADCLEVITVTNTTDNIAERVSSLNIDLVLISIDLINSGRDKLVEGIRSISPETKIIALVSETSGMNILNAMKYSIDGIIDKTHDIKSLILVSQLVIDGFQCIPKYNLYDDDVKRIDSLFKREYEIFQYISQGMSNKDIGDKINISVKTVSVHRYNIMYKLNIKNSMDLYKLCGLPG